MIAALEVDGIKTRSFGNWPIDGESFLGFIRQGLAHVLRAGDFVVMDNLSAHKVVGVKEVIEATDARLVYLLPHSSDYSPIKLCW